MPHTLTRSQELFAQAVAAGYNATAAYRLAYNAEKMKPATVWRNAHSTRRHNKVAARIEELLTAAAQTLNLTPGAHIIRLRQLSAAAEEEGRYSAAIRAEHLVGVVAKLYQRDSDPDPNAGLMGARVVVVPAAVLDAEQWAALALAHQRAHPPARIALPWEADEDQTVATQTKETDDG